MKIRIVKKYYYKEALKIFEEMKLIREAQSFCVIFIRLLRKKHPILNMNDCLDILEEKILPLLWNEVKDSEEIKTLYKNKIPSNIYWFPTKNINKRINILKKVLRKL